MADLSSYLSRKGRGWARRELGVVASLLLLALLMLLAISALIGLARGHSTYDGIANWALKSYAIAYECSIFAGERWGGHGLAYPQGLRLSIAFFRLLYNDVLPGSKLLFPALAWSLFLGSVDYLQRRDIDLRFALLIVLVAATTPVLFFHSTIGFANLPFTSFLVLGALAWLAGVGEKDIGRQLAGALLLGLAAWIRPEGVGIGLVVLALGSGYRWVVDRSRLPSFRAMSPFVLVTVVWLSLGLPRLANEQVGGVISGAFSQRSRGVIEWEVVPRLGRFAFQRFLDWRDWGLVWPLSLMATAGLLRKLRSGNTVDSGPMTPVLIGIVALPLFMFWVALHNPGYGNLFLHVSFDRALFPAAVLLICLAGLILGYTGRPNLVEGIGKGK